MLQEKMNNPNSVRENRQRIGAILMHNGKISEQDTTRIVEMQKQQSMLFGEAAVKLKLVRKEDIEQALSSQLLIPTIDVEKYGLSQELVIACKPLSRQAEAFRDIRTQLLLKANKDVPICLAIVSTGAQEGKSYAVANLAITFAQMGKRTLIIDSDLRHPKQHVLFNTTNSYGLSTILAKNEISDFSIKHEGLVNLSILPAGPVPVNPLELLSQQTYTHVLQHYKSRYEVILIDTPAANSFSDSEMIAATAQSVVLLSRQDSTPLDPLKAYAEKLKANQVNVLGSILNVY